MSDLTSLLADSLLTATAIAFIGAMPTFFRSRRGHWLGRLLLLLGIAAGVLALSVPLARRKPIAWPACVAGCGLLMASHILFWGAVWAHGSSRPSGAFAVDAPADLTARGPYRLLRHPFYVAYVLAFAAGATFTETLWAWTVPAGMAVVYWTAARQEERLILASPLASTYFVYRSQVGGFIPRLASLRSWRAIGWIVVSLVFLAAAILVAAKMLDFTVPKE